MTTQLFAYWCIVPVFFCIYSFLGLFAVAMFIDYKEMGNYGDLVASLLCGILTVVAVVLSIVFFIEEYPTV